jgi:hypothetical protein
MEDSMRIRRHRRAKTQIVEGALEQSGDKVFWAEVQSAFAEPEPDDLRVERELWDRTVGDGLDETR